MIDKANISNNRLILIWKEPIELGTWVKALKDFVVFVLHG